MKSSIQHLKDYQSSLYREFTENQKEQNELLDKLMDIREELSIIQIEMNDTQMAIEKLERPE